MKQILFSINFQKKSQKTLVEIGKVHIGVFLKSPILGTKKEILKLILSDCKIEGKNLCFSINKPFDELIKTAETDKWCR